MWNAIFLKSKTVANNHQRSSNSRYDFTLRKDRTNNGAMQGTHLYILYHFQTKITLTSSFNGAMDFITRSHLYWCTFGNTLIQYNICIIHRKLYWNFNIFYACVFWFKSWMYFSYDCGRYGIEMRALCFMCQWNVHMVLNKPAWAGYIKNWAI